MYDPALRRTPEEWCEQYGMVVLDPDGWRTSGAPAWTDPIGLAEFLERAKPSTTNGAATGAFNRIEADLRAYVVGAEPPDGVPPRPMRLGELREALVQVMDLEGCHSTNLHESKDVLVHVNGSYLRLTNVQPVFHNGRFVLLLVAGAPDPEPGSPAWYAEHPGAERA